MGSAGFSPTPASERLQSQLHTGIRQQLQVIAKHGDFVAAIYEGLLGSPEDGLHPGRTGRGTVQEQAA